jgi:aspartyl-tRNA(Asn)/glutamyl-tRNA(Gln) amidotransferase subunit B
MEIVTMNPPPPGLDQIESAEEAREYLVRLRAILVYIGVNDGKMEEGSLRCEPNISIRPKGQTKFGTKTEIKNLNSFRSVFGGVEYELKRQEKVLREGGKIIQETRRWDDARGVTVSMRTKEFEQDYRYFPEPDLVPLVFETEWIEKQRSLPPELPQQKKHRYMEEYGISETDADILTDSKAVAEFFESCVGHYSDAKVCSNWILGEFLRLVNSTGIEPEQAKVKPEEVGELLKMVDKNTVNRNTAKSVFEEMFNTGKSAKQIVEEKGLVQISDESAIADAVRRVLANNSSELERYKAGEERLMGFFVGQVMRETKGKANPGVVNKLLKEELAKV